VADTRHASLAFPAADFPAYEAAGKIGTLAGSVVSADRETATRILDVMRIKNSA